MKGGLLLSLLFFMSISSWAGDLVFIREYTYKAGDADSKTTSRKIAKQELKREILNEVGTNIYSKITIVSDGSGEVISKQEVRALTAGFVKLKVIEESWDGFEFYLKAELLVDPDDVQRQINQMLSNEAEKALLQRQLSEQAEVVEKLRIELLAINKSLRESKSEKERVRISKVYAEKSNEMDANDYYDKGLDFTWGIRGESIDASLAVKWYAKAAQLGHERALYNLSLAYYEGKGVRKDYDKAAQGMLELAQSNFVDAQFQLSNMYRYGHGVVKDYEQEMYWLEAAAGQDLYIAQVSLDERYREGGIPESSTRPVFWLTKSAERGDPTAQYRLALRYRDGLGVVKNRTLFNFWLDKAGKGGDQDAILLLKELGVRPNNKS